MFKDYAWINQDALIARTEDGDYEAWQKTSDDPEEEPYRLAMLIAFARENLEMIEADESEKQYIPDPERDRKDRQIIIGFLKKHGRI